MKKKKKRTDTQNCVTTIMKGVTYAQWKYQEKRERNRKKYISETMITENFVKCKTLNQKFRNLREQQAR